MKEIIFSSDGLQSGLPYNSPYSILERVNRSINAAFGFDIHISTDKNSNYVKNSARIKIIKNTVISITQHKKTLTILLMQRL